MSVALDVPSKIDIASQDWKILPDIWETLAHVIPHESMLVDPVHEGNIDLSYSEVNSLITQGAAAFQTMGVKEGDAVSIFSENSHRWLLAEQAIMKTGACNAVRGALAPVKELQYIHDNSESVGSIIETPVLLKEIYGQGGLSSAKHGAPQFIVVLFANCESSAELAESIGAPAGTAVLTYEDFMAKGKGVAFKPVTRDNQSPATLVYTSGTTNSPKGVILNHENLLHQVFFNSFNRNQDNKYDPWVGDVFVSILPCWHIFERTAEYFCLSRGAQMIYSNLRNFKTDMGIWKPHFLIAVPRLFENIHKGIMSNIKSMSPAKKKLVAFFTAVTRMYVKCRRVVQNLQVRDKKPNVLERLFFGLLTVLLFPLYKAADTLVWKKIRENLGGRLKTMVSGGSSIPVHIESFFDIAGINLLVGYGLTETSPVICNRIAEHNIMGTVGLPPPGTELKVVNVDTRQEVPCGTPGLVLARGPGIMKGYKNNPAATAAAIASDGFFDTGDLGRINPSTGDFIITGRAKDTIVLSNGENVEPQSIEMALVAKSALIDQVMLVGQDSTYLGGVCVLNVQELVKRGFLDAAKGKELRSILGPTPTSTGPAGDVGVLRSVGADLRVSAALKAALMAEVRDITGVFKSWERVGAVHIVLEPFSVANGQLTMTLKTKRHAVAAAYDTDIKAFYRPKK
jgi:long-chain acyl-CoA synthetase